MGPDDATPPPGEEGELHVRGSLLFAGYFNHPEANRDVFSADGSCSAPAILPSSTRKGTSPSRDGVVSRFISWEHPTI